LVYSHLLPSFPTRRSSDLRPSSHICWKDFTKNAGGMRALPTSLASLTALPSANARRTWTISDTSSTTLPPPTARVASPPATNSRSEEHTSELQSLAHLVCR